MASYTGSNQDGDRASKLAKQRDADKEAFEKTRTEMQKSSKVGLKGMDDMFVDNQSFQAEERFKMSTVGLSSIEDFKKKRLMVEEMKAAAEKKQKKARKKLRKMAEKERKKKLSALTFADDDEEEDEAEKDEFAKHKKRRLAKDPSVDTFFLKDKARDDEDAALRKKFADEWQGEQDVIKKEKIEVTYSYWDGSGHRRQTEVEKGTTIEKFLEKIRRECAETFHELRGLQSEHLMYIKEDLIIPHHYSFYDLIVSKARGKSGPLFHFDVHDDIRLRADTRVEKDESHAGKIITRSYYERNQHIFPVNRWEVYDPAKKFDEYTIKDRSA